MGGDLVVEVEIPEGVGPGDGWTVEIDRPTPPHAAGLEDGSPQLHGPGSARSPAVHATPRGG